MAGPSCNIFGFHQTDIMFTAIRRILETSHLRPTNVGRSLQPEPSSAAGLHSMSLSLQAALDGQSN